MGKEDVAQCVKKGSNIKYMILLYSLESLLSLQSKIYYEELIVDVAYDIGLLLQMLFNCLSAIKDKMFLLIVFRKEYKMDCYFETIPYTI